MYRELSRVDHSLRYYQQQAKDSIFAKWDEVDNILYQMPTGTGKTRLFTSIIRDIVLFNIENKKRWGILIIAHRSELIEQIDASLNKYRISHGIISGDKKFVRDLTLPVQVASIQTITHPANARLVELFRADFIIIDEAHHAIARSYNKLWKFYPRSKKLGVTATPWRMDGRGFADIFNAMIPSAPIKDFLAQGWLAPYKYYSAHVSELWNNIDAIRRFSADGDYQVSALESLVDQQRIRAQLLDSYLELAAGKKGIIYSISRKHSKSICMQFRDVGIAIADIDSETPAQLRHKLVADFKQGKIQILVNVDIFSEGFDCPDLEFVQLARPTRSLVKYLQQVGRGLRKNGDKQCIILDNVGLCERFGFPDTDRPWDSYFNGIAKTADDILQSLERNILRNESREPDLSEGFERMALRQSFDISETGIEDEKLEELDRELSPVSIVLSRRIFSKYQIYEDEEGIGVVNCKSGEKQNLCQGLKRKSITIKVSKTENEKQKWTVTSSINRNKQLSTNDKIIGYLFKEGAKVVFESANRISKKTITI